MDEFRSSVNAEMHRTIRKLIEIAKTLLSKALSEKQLTRYE